MLRRTAAVPLVPRHDADDGARRVARSATDALVEEGLKTAAADTAPQDGKKVVFVSQAVPPPLPRRARPTGPSPAAGLSTDALQVSDHGVGTGLVDHRLVGRAYRFAEGTLVSFWSLVLGGQPGHVIRHVWFQEKADLPIGGPHWRTHSRLLLSGGSAGLWAVEARTSDGRLRARDEFLCESDRQ
jgi:hypothetical protein